MIKRLDEILLSENVVENFYKAFNSDNEFKKLLDQFIPEIEDCENREQDNPWHKYNVLGHLLHSVQAMNNQTKDLDFKERRMLAYVMLFHDIGKPATHIRRMKNGKMQDSFFDHNVKSEEIAKRVLPILGFDESERKIMQKLIFKHDIFMYIKLEETNNPHWRKLTNEIIKEEISDLNEVGDGYKLMKYLIWVGRSDNLAQNEKMTGDSLKMLDKFEQMLSELKSIK